MERLDKFLNESWEIKSRDRAIELIKNWKIQVNWKKITKPSFKVNWEEDILIMEEDLKWVWRAWLKLEKAVEEFEIDFNNAICMDIWASTWGFSDVMLQENASKVFAVDVWHSQLHEKILNNPKVVNLEKTNARDMEFKLIWEKADFITIDVSFISLDKIIPNLKKFLKDSGEIIALIKPQFELDRTCLSKSGVVKEESDREKAIQKIKTVLKKEGFKTNAFTTSPITWSNWNVEYLIKFHITERL